MCQHLGVYDRIARHCNIVHQYGPLGSQWGVYPRAVVRLNVHDTVHVVDTVPGHEYIRVDRQGTSHDGLRRLHELGQVVLPVNGCVGAQFGEVVRGAYCEDEVRRGYAECTAALCGDGEEGACAGGVLVEEEEDTAVAEATVGVQDSDGVGGEEGGQLDAATQGLHCGRTGETAS